MVRIWAIAQEITGTIEPWDHWDKAGWMEIRPWHQLEKNGLKQMGKQYGDMDLVPHSSSLFLSLSIYIYIYIY
jgi:hypothetical protein